MKIRILLNNEIRKENSLQYLRTPLEILKEHHLDECALIMAPKKKKKILQRKISTTEASYKGFADDYKKYLNI